MRGSRVRAMSDIAITEITKEIRAKFCVGDEITVADICLVPQLYNAVRFNIDLEKEFPELYQIDKNMQAVAEVAAAHPSQQPDAPKD